MQPQQTPNSNNQNYQPQGYDPQPHTPQPQVPNSQYYQGQQTPPQFQHPQAQQPNPAQSQQPYPAQSQPTSYTQQQQQQQQHQNPSWYTAPDQQKVNTSPSKASDYVSRASAPASQQGQVVNGQYSIDYLNGMPGANQSKISKKFIAIIAAALTGTIGLAAALFAMTPTPDTASPSATLSSVYTIMVDTQDVTKQAGKNIKNSKLRGVNSSLDTVLLSTMKSLENPLTSSGSKASTLRSEAKKPPIKDDELRNKLDEARLQVMYDQVYLMQMEFKVQEIMRRMEYVHKRVGSDTTKDALSTGYDSLNRIKESIQSFSNSEDSGII